MCMYVRMYTAILSYCRAVPTYSFVDYLRGGCEINLVVAIDFTVRSLIVPTHTLIAILCRCRAPMASQAILIPYTTTIHIRYLQLNS